MKLIALSGKIKIAIAAVLILVVLFFSDMEEVGEALTNVDWWLILAVVVLYLINLVVKAYRWSVLMRATGNRVSFSSVFSTFTFSQALNNILPGRVVGETSRIYEVKSSNGVKVGAGLASVVTERLMDFIVLTILAMTSLVMLLAYLSDDLKGQLMFVVALLVVANFFFIYILINPNIAKRVGNWTAGLITKLGFGKKGERLNKTVLGFVQSFNDAVHSKEKGSKKLISWAAVITIFIWINEIARTWLIIMALGVDVSILAVVASCSLASLSGVFLSAGSGNVVVSSVIYTASGLDPHIAATAGVLSAMTSIWLSVPVSIIAVILHGKKVAGSKKEIEPGM